MIEHIEKPSETVYVRLKEIVEAERRTDNYDKIKDPEDAPPFNPAPEFLQDLVILLIYGNVFLY